MNTSRTCVSIVVGDPNPVFLCGLISVLNPTQGFKVVARCTDGWACVRAIRELSPNIVLIDISFFDCIKSSLCIAAKVDGSPHQLIVFATAVDGLRSIPAAVHGHVGVLPKDVAPQQLLYCLRQAATGKKLSPLAPAKPTGIYADDVEHDRLSASLTGREREIAQLVSHGLSNKEIGRELRLSAGTVKIHLHRVYQKLALHNRTALAVRSLQTDRPFDAPDAQPAELSPPPR